MFGVKINFEEVKGRKYFKISKNAAATEHESEYDEGKYNIKSTKKE